jgi:hypothetical protein
LLISRLKIGWKGKRMSREYFSILGLTPGRCEPKEVARRFHTRRRRLLAQLADSTRYAESRRQLDLLHRAYNALSDPRRQAEHVRAAREEGTDEDRVARLRRLIEVSLEGGLLRYSRRAEILVEGRRLGFSEFQTHLMIAQVQFGGELAVPPTRSSRPTSAETPSRVGARFAAAGVLALAIFLAAIRWLGA